MFTGPRIEKAPEADPFAVVRFGAASLLCALVDNAVFYVVFHASGRIAEAQICARCVSVLFNYMLVKTSVFRSPEPHVVLLPRYILLITLNALLSYAGIRLLTSISPIGVIPAKMLSETLLFLMNYMLQRAYVFRRSSARTES